MATCACPLCGATTADVDRFCAACGVRLDAPIVFDAFEPPQRSSEDAGTGGNRLAAVVVPVAVVAVLGLGAVLLFTTNSGDTVDDADETLAQPDRADERQPSPSLETTPTPTRRPRPTPTTPPLDVGEPVDLSALPPTDATHIVVLMGGDVGFLDLASGMWNVHADLGPFGADAERLIPFGSGVATNSGHGAVHLRPDRQPTELGNGWVIGSFDELLWLQPANEDGLVGSTLVGIDEEGIQVDEIEVPSGVWPAGVLPSAGIVMWAGGHVFVVDRAGAEIMRTGSLQGVADGQLLVQTCGGNLECGISLLEPELGIAFDIEIVPLHAYLELVERDTIVVWGRDQQTIYRVVDGALVEDEEARFDSSGRILPDALTATDTTGLYARADGGRVFFHDPTGDVITEVEPPFNPRRTITELHFITAPTPAAG